VKRYKMKRAILVLLTALTTLILMASLGFALTDETEATEDIGARVPVDVKITPTSFAPNLSRAQGISIAREFAEKGFTEP
jgi:hypothetical protein